MAANAKRPMTLYVKGKKVKGRRVLIIGTYESVPCCALADEFTPDPEREGEFLPEFAGESRMYWDAQEQETTTAGKPLYVGSDGDVYTADQLELRPVRRS